MAGMWIPIWKNLALTEKVGYIYTCECGQVFQSKINAIPAKCPYCEMVIEPPAV